MSYGIVIKKFGQDIELIEDEEKLVNIFETNWYKQISATLTSGDAVKVYRENLGLTPAELGKKLGDLTAEEIFEMECNKRRINRKVAKKLSQLFDVPIDRFL